MGTDDEHPCKDELTDVFSSMKLKAAKMKSKALACVEYQNPGTLPRVFNTCANFKKSERRDACARIAGAAKTAYHRVFSDSASASEKCQSQAKKTCDCIHKKKQEMGGGKKMIHAGK